MALDGITLHGIKRELQENLTGGWIRKIYQPRPELVTINVWNDDNYRLLISCGEDFRIQLTDLEFENPQEPPPFTMLLRKHLSGGKISRITQRGLDRVLRISVGVKDEEEDEIKTKELYVELMGRNSNLFLVQDGQITERLRNRKSRKRSVSPGGEYEFPPAQDKVDPFELRKEEFYDFLAPDEPVWRNLLNNIEGIGPTLAREIPVRAGVAADQKELSDEERESLWGAADNTFSLLERITSGNYSALVYQEDGVPVEFSPIQLESYSDKEEISFESLSDALDHYYKARETSFETQELREEIEETIDEELNRVQGALKNVKDQLQQSDNREKLKEAGDIILANLGELEKGMKSARLTDPYNEGV
ncbi:NFACT family protein, partial [Candidatus Bipolaricaulota bacterium]|nr:NFACT family protein [Candidatus Bipolaricaulota bacterium]